MRKHAAAGLACSILALAVAASGCFDGDGERRRPTSALAAAVSYLRSDSSTAFVIETDLVDGPLRRLGTARLRSDGRRGLEAVLRSAIEQRGIDFDEVIRPQLG